MKSSQLVDFCVNYKGFNNIVSFQSSYKIVQVVFFKINFGSLYISKNLTISSKLSNLGHRVVHYISILLIQCL